MSSLYIFFNTESKIARFFSFSKCFIIMRMDPEYAKGELN